jgi:hypothetical protein
MHAKNAAVRRVLHRVGMRFRRLAVVSAVIAIGLTPIACNTTQLVEPSESSAQAICSTCSSCGPSPQLADLMFAETPPPWAPADLIALVRGSNNSTTTTTTTTTTMDAGTSPARLDDDLLTNWAVFDAGFIDLVPANLEVDNGVGALGTLGAVNVTITGDKKWKIKSPIPRDDAAMIFFARYLQKYCPVGALGQQAAPVINCQDHAASATACMAQLKVQYEGSTTTSPMEAYFVGAHCSCTKDIKGADLPDGKTEPETHAMAVGCIPTADGKQKVCAAVEPAWMKGDDTPRAACGFNVPNDGAATPAIHPDCQGFFCATIRQGSCSVEKLSILPSDKILEKYARNLFGPAQCPKCAAAFREATKAMTDAEMDPSTMAPVKPGPAVIKKVETK